MNILGISAYFHDSSASLVQDGRVVSAISEERLSGKKGDADFPILAINRCLQEGNITALNLDAIAFFEKPFLKFSRVLSGHLDSWPRSFSVFSKTMPSWLGHRLALPHIIKKELGCTCPIYFIPHHLSHGASAFYPSPWEEAAIMCTDGIGEWASMSLNVGKNNKITNLYSIKYPDSLGLLFTAITTWLGFYANSGEGKTMALAAYGEYDPKIEEELIKIHLDGSFTLNKRYLDFGGSPQMYTIDFIKKFGQPKKASSPFEDNHYAMAASLQKITEKILVNSANYLNEITKIDYLCLAGGVHLNCLANSKINEKRLFKDIFIQPAAGDAGGSLGASLFLSAKMDKAYKKVPLEHTFLGPSYTNDSIKRAVLLKNLPHAEYEDQELLPEIAKLLSQGKVIAWYDGKMEFGPRALGARSILADPRKAWMKDHLNKTVKHREEFRPFGASILKERADQWFEPLNPNPFMLMASTVKSDKWEKIPAAIHRDGTSRIQTVDEKIMPRYHRLISEFNRITNIPMIINTSFNDRGKPIVCSPEDALEAYLDMDIDGIVLGPFLLLKENPEKTPDI